MKLRCFFKNTIFCCSLAMAASLPAHTQGPGGHPPGPPPDGNAPGMPPGPGGPPANGPGGAPSPGSPTSHVVSVTTPMGIKLGPPGRWWDDSSFVRVINLRRDQQRKMDAIFDANKPALIATYKAFQAQQAKLNALSKASHVDQTQLFAAIDAVNQARASLQKVNTEMLLQIRQQLTSGQVSKLDTLP